MMACFQRSSIVCVFRGGKSGLTPVGILLWHGTCWGFRSWWSLDSISTFCIILVSVGNCCLRSTSLLTRADGLNLCYIYSFFWFSFVDGRQVTEYFGSKACQVKWQRLNRCVIRQSVKNSICHNLVCPRFWYRSSTIIYVQGWYWDSLYIPLLHGRWWSLYTRLYNWLGWWLNVWLFAHHCFTSASEESLRVSFLTLSSINIIFNSSLFAACFVAN